MIFIQNYLAFFWRKAPKGCSVKSLPVLGCLLTMWMRISITLVLNGALCSPSCHNLHMLPLMSLS